MSLAAVLLNLLYTTFCIPGEPLVFALDDTIERRWGAKITKRSTPCLLGLMSICFSDVLTAVRMELWENTKLPISPISGLMNNYYAKMRYTLIQAVV